MYTNLAAKAYPRAVLHVSRVQHRRSRDGSLHFSPIFVHLARKASYSA